MKKIIILLTSAIFVFSILIMSACGKQTADTSKSDQSVSSSEELNSSSGKISRNFGGDSTLDTSGNGSDTQPSASNPTSTTGGTVISGDSLYIKQTPVPEGTSLNASLLIQQINAIESVTPSNFRIIEATIADAEYYYNNELTPSERAEVVNYSDLVAAREAYDKLLAQAEVNEFIEKYSQLDSISTPTKKDVPLVASLKSMIDDFSADQTAKITDWENKKSKVLSVYDSLKAQGFMQFSFIADEQTVTDSEFFIFSNLSPETGSTGQDKFTVDGKYLSNTVRFNFGETITFNTSITGTLKIYCSNNDRTATCTHDDGSATIETKVMIPDADDNNYREFAITKVGNYTLTINEGEIFIYAIILTA